MNLLKYFLSLTTLAGLYIISGRLGLSLDAISGYATWVWPPSGIALAALLLFGKKLWPGIFIGAFFVNYSLPVSTLLTALGIATGNTLEIIVAVWLLEKLTRFSSSFEKLENVLSLVFVAAIFSPVVAATVGIYTLSFSGTLQNEMLFSTWIAWWAGDFMGILMFCPLVLICANPAFRTKSFTLESLAFLLSVFICGLVIYSDLNVGSFESLTLCYLLFPLLMWASLRLGTLHMIVGYFLLFSIAVIGTKLGKGPFIHDRLSDSLLFLQIFLATLLVSNLVLSSVMRELSLSREVEKMARERADIANRAKGSFVATISHEIRNPLFSIVGFSDLLRKEDLVVDEKNKYVDIIIRNSNQLLKLIDSILDLEKIEAGSVQLEVERVIIHDFINEVVTSLKIQAQQKNLYLKLEISEYLPEVIFTDYFKLRQILLNVIGNAIKFTSSGGVSVHVKQSSIGPLVFEVKDTGVGISSEQVVKLFEPFAQGDSSIYKKFGGSGLGLSVAKKLAKALGGDVFYDGSFVEQGSVFLVEIPISINSTGVKKDSLPQELKIVNVKNKEKKEDAVAFDISGTKVLLVEDSLDNQLLITHYLAPLKVKVKTANNGEEGVRAALNKNFDIILMDLQMPVMDGLQAAEALRKNGFTKPIIALTASAMKHNKEKCLEAGFNNFISKPVEISQLVKVIFNTIHKSHNTAITNS